MQQGLSCDGMDWDRMDRGLVLCATHRSTPERPDWGLFVQKDCKFEFRVDDVITEYKGPRINREKLASYSDKGKSYAYLASLGPLERGKLYIDGHRYNQVARQRERTGSWSGMASMANDPDDGTGRRSNCMLFATRCVGTICLCADAKAKTRLFLVATESISPGEEVLLNYGGGGRTVPGAHGW